MHHAYPLACPPHAVGTTAPLTPDERTDEMTEMGLLLLGVTAGAVSENRRSTAQGRVVTWDAVEELDAPRERPAQETQLWRN